MKRKEKSSFWIYAQGWVLPYVYRMKHISMQTSCRVFHHILLGVRVPAISKVIWTCHEFARGSTEIILGVPIIISTQATQLLFVAV